MIQRILIAVNASEPAEWAAQVGLGLAEQLGAQAAVIHVLDMADAITPVMAEVATGYSVITHPAVVVPALGATLNTPVRERREDGIRLIARIVSAANANLCPVEFLREGRAVDEILAVADEWQAQLIVMGTHGRRPLIHMIMGSTSEAVLRRTKCPVLLVHQKPEC